MKNKNLVFILLATSVQFYNNTILGFLAANLAENYLPPNNDEQKIANFFLIFSIALVLRPFAALLTGYIGDKYSRITAIKFCLYIIILANIALGCSPVYFYIGKFAVIILIIANIIVSSFSLPQIDGARIYITENIDAKSLYFGQSLITASMQLGAAFAAATAFIVNLKSMPEYCWRLAFIQGAFFSAILIYNLNKLPNSKNNHLSELDISDRFFNLLKTNFKYIILIALIMGCFMSLYFYNVYFYNIFIFEILELADEASVRKITLIGILFYIFNSLLAGYFTDKFQQPIKISLLSLSIIIIIQIINCYLISQNNFQALLYLLGLIILPLVTVPIIVNLKKIFPVKNRYKLFSFSNALGSAIIGGAVPSICSLIIKHSTTNYLVILFIIFVHLLLAGCIYNIRKALN